MSHRFVVDPDSHCIAVMWRGAITLDAARAYFADIAALPEFPHRRGVLHDLRDADIMIDLADLDIAKDLQKQIRPKAVPARRLAAIVNSAYQFGQARQVLTKLEMDDDILVTYSEAEARAHAGLPAHVDLTDGAPGPET